MAFYERGQLNNICNSTQQSAIAQSVVSEMEKAVSMSSMASLKLNNMCNSTQLYTRIICRDLYLKGCALANTKLEFSALCVSNLQQENRLNGRIQLNFLQCFCDMVLLHQCCELLLDALGGVQSTYKSCCMLFQHSCVQ